MNIYKILGILRKYCKRREQVYKIVSLLKKSGIFILTHLILVFGFGNLYAQHLFSVSYNDLSQENARQIKTQVGNANTSITPLTRGMKNEYALSLSTVQNTRIIILNEETGNNVVITPTEASPAQFRLQPFFIEELKRSALGDVDRYLMIEVGADFSVRNVASFSVQTEEVFIPRYFYGIKEDVKEALPEDREIIHIFKEKPRFIPAFPDDPENLRHIAQLEEEQSYYVYMYKLPDGTLCIYDEHFNPSAEENEVSTSTRASIDLQFNLFTTTLNTQQKTATKHAYDLWSVELAGMIPVDIEVNFVSLTTPASSYPQPHYWNPVTQMWYCSALGNQLAGYKVSNLRDIRVDMNSNSSWHYDPTSNPPSGQYDWITIMLHEITHGLGFAALVKSDGQYRYITSGGVLTPHNSPGIFDYQLYNASGTNLTALNPTQRAALVVSNNLYSGRPGSYLLAANNGSRVKMYAPSPWVDGSSVSHWDDSVTFSTFMKRAYGGKLHTIDLREAAIMLDMGWYCQTVNITGTVNVNRTVQSCGDINVANVTVTSNAKLTLEAVGSVIFTGDLDLASGTELEIK